MPNLLSIDPGNCTGWAIFNSNELTYAGVTSVDDPCLYAATGVFPWDYLFRGGQLVIEIPQVYRASKSKGDPNDLIKVAVQAGQWIERARLYGASVYRQLPQEWKGQVPKETHHKRILAVLNPTELARLPKLPKSDAHNMLDAIGLGLFHLGRISRGAGGQVR